MRIVTRLAHSRPTVRLAEPRGQNPVTRAPLRSSWILLPANARRQWNELLDRQAGMQAWSESSPRNALTLNPERRELGVEELERLTGK